MDKSKYENYGMAANWEGRFALIAYDFRFLSCSTLEPLSIVMEKQMVDLSMPLGR